MARMILLGSGGDQKPSVERQDCRKVVNESSDVNSCYTSAQHHVGMIYLCNTSFIQLISLVPGKHRYESYSWTYQSEKIKWLFFENFALGGRVDNEVNMHYLPGVGNESHFKYGADVSGYGAMYVFGLTTQL